MAPKTTPMFSPDEDMENVTPQTVADAKKRAKQTEAFNAAEKSTPPAPKTPASAPKKFAGGGFVRSADGIAKKGKTKGRIC